MVRNITVREGVSEKIIFKLQPTKRENHVKDIYMQSGQKKQGRVPGKSGWHGLGFDK